MDSSILRGQTIITFFDNVHLTSLYSIRRAPVFVIFLFVGFIGIPLFNFILNPESNNIREVFVAMPSMIYGAWKYLLFGAVAYFAGLHIIGAICYWRANKAVWKMTYAAETEGIRFTDGMGSSLLMPWATIRKVRRTKRYLILFMQVGPMRFIPLKAFANPETLWSIVADSVKQQRQSAS